MMAHRTNVHVQVVRAVPVLWLLGFLFRFAHGTPSISQVERLSTIILGILLGVDPRVEILDIVPDRPADLDSGDFSNIAQRPEGPFGDSQCVGRLPGRQK